MRKKENKQEKSTPKKETIKEPKPEKPQTTDFVTKMEKPVNIEKRDKK